MRSEQPTKCLYQISSEGVIAGIKLVSVMFNLMFVYYTFSWFGLLGGHLLGNNYPLGWAYVLIVFCLFVFFIHFKIWF